jgi:outer membrane protein assembly factor BamE
MSDKIPNPRLAPALLMLFTLLTGCVSLYTPEVQQGNVISTEMLESLKIGMSRRQVVFLLGTPLIADPFHQERWDYFYSLSKNGGKPVQHHLIVQFKGDEVVALEGDLTPRSIPEVKTTPGEAGRT